MRWNKSVKYFSLPLLFIFLIIKAANAQIQQDGQWQAPQTLQQLKNAPVALIPFPREVKWRHLKYVLNSKINIHFSSTDTAMVGYAIQSLEGILQGKTLYSKKTVSNEKLTSVKDGIRFLFNKNLSVKAEGYLLEINKNSIDIIAKDAPGFYYAVQTLRQLITKENNAWQIPACTIKDWPSFSVRGFMHDNGRNFQSIELLMQQLEILSQYKFNIFHWHLTDNPAWRPQSKIFPQLNDPQNRKPGRDPDSTYSFDDIRKIIKFAREHCMTVIPELDMPGHSKYFETTFGFKMETEQGMEVLEKLVDEFCNEIPATDCPVLHIGSDEVHIHNPKEFIQRMTARVKANGRKVMVWNPGLPPEKGTIEQVWRDDLTNGKRTNDNNPLVDSYAGYLNSYDALSLVQRYFFQQVCNQPNGDSMALGGILCCWPDTRVDDKTKISLYNPVWPGALAYSEAVWCGRPGYVPAYQSVLPEKGSTAWQYFEEFESRLANHREKFFSKAYFPFVKFSNAQWQLIGPFHRTENDSITKAFLQEKSLAFQLPATVPVQNVTGNVLRMEGWFPSATLAKKATETIYLNAYIFSPQAQQINVMIGFETAVRSNRRSGGIPLTGRWDANGGTIFLNGKELKGPQWEKPGACRYLQPTWETPANEIPFTDEEFYWSRPPSIITLQKGWNKILVRLPRAYSDQAWMFAFVPVKQIHGQWVEDTSIKIKAERK